MIALGGREADEESAYSGYSDDLEEYYSEYTNGDGNSSDGSRYSADIYDELGSEYEGYDARDMHF